MLNYRYLALALAMASGVASAAATNADAPASFGGTFKAIDQVATTHYGALDLTTIAEQDALREAAGRPMRFAIAHDSSLNARDGGTWEVNGDRAIWRLRVQAEDAASLNFGFTRYHLPASARLFIYDNKNHEQLAGPYDSSHNSLGQLWTPIIASTDVMVELDVALSDRGQVDLLLGKINQGYRGFGTASKGYHQPGMSVSGEGKSACSPDAIRSGSCNMDVACLDSADPWNGPRNSVGAYTMSGTDTCTGSLVNNTSGDRSLLFMTASHCEVVNNPAAIVVYWKYESPTCRTPGSPASGTALPKPTTTSSGSTFIARTRNPFDSGDCTNGAVCSDNTLVKLSGAADPAWTLFWAGWDHSSTGAHCVPGSTASSTIGECAGIHHPNVDEKRITFVETDFTLGGIAGGTNTHWHAFWDPTPPILPNIVAPPPSLPPGVTEPGSSGSPLYNASQRFVGVLSGGPSACGATGANLSDFYGQLSVAWEGEGAPATRMKDHLDPTASGVMFIDGVGMTPFNFSLTPPSLSVCTTSNTATVNLAATYDVGFSGTVALAATGNPVPSTAVFAPPTMTPPTAASVLTLGNLSAVAPGNYSISVTGTSGADTVTKALPLTIAGALSGSVTLLTPADGATGVATSPTLTWQAMSGAASYTVEVATDSGFTSIVATQAGISGTSYAPTGLNPNVTYYWHVKPTNGCGDGTVSATFSFTTANVICRNPALAIPDNVPAGVNDTLTLSDTSVLDGLQLSIKTTHTWVGDLKYTLSKAAVTSLVIDRPGAPASANGCNADDIDVTLDDAAASPVENACSTTPPALGGTLKPNAPGLAPFVGQTLAGTWTLNVSDNAGQDIGTLTEWCLIPTLAVSDVIFADGFDELP
jgi:subtilisin-like proprotein convertase family protein